MTLMAGAAAGQGMPPAPVVVAPVAQREITLEKTFVGSVEPLRASTVGSEVDGRVTEFLVREGDAVKESQPLAQIRTRELEIELASAHADRELRAAELAELENGSRPGEVEEASAAVASAEAKVTYWKSKLARTQELRQKSTVSEEDLEVAQRSSLEAEAELRQAKAALELVKDGPRQERIDQARARLASADEEINRLEDLKERCTIRAPFAGHVVRTETEKGEWLSRGNPVAEVADLKEVDVEVPVVEDFISRVTVGMTVIVDLGALPDEPLTGTVVEIVPQADLLARTFPVKVRLKNREEGGVPLIKAGMFARVHLAVGSKGQATVVPKDAIVMGGPTPIVYALVPSADNPRAGTVRPVPVELGGAAGNDMAVQGPLGPGVQVVVRGNERLRPGQEVIVTGVQGEERPTTAPAGEERPGNSR